MEKVNGVKKASVQVQSRQVMGAATGAAVGAAAEGAVGEKMGEIISETLGDELDLTKNEKSVLQYIRQFSSKKGYPPSYSEIQKKFELKAKSSVQQYIEQLKKKGFLAESPKKERRLPLQLIEVRSSEDNSEVISIPLEGKVAAGRLTEAVHHREYIDVPRFFVKSDAEYFALKVKGDSMIDNCIMDGDTVIIRRQSNAANGQTVVALVNDEATIKKYYRRKECIELVPANPNYSVIKVDSAEDFKILGILSSVIRQVEQAR